MKTHTIELRVRYGETDQMGIVYNAEMLTYFEVARTEFLRAHGTTYRSLEETGSLLAVSEAHCYFRGPASYDDLLEVTTWVERMRGTRIDFAHRIRRKEDGALVCEGSVVLASLNSDMRPARLPAAVSGIIEPLPGGPDE